MQENILDLHKFDSPEIHYAPFWQRMVAFIIDVLLLLAISWLLTLDLFALPEYVNLIFLNLSYLYKPFMEYYYQTSFGKKVFGIKVVSSDLGKPSLWQVLIRNSFGVVFQLISLFFEYGIITSDMIFGLNMPFQIPVEQIKIGYLVMYFMDPLLVFLNTKNQALHDIIAKTIVIRKK